jgi:hypothetical protein
LFCSNDKNHLYDRPYQLPMGANDEVKMTFQIDIELEHYKSGVSFIRQAPIIGIATQTL